MIEVAGVSKTYGATTVVDNVSLSLPAGGVTAIVGPNGAGKSTLLSLIARLAVPDSGRITVGGLDVASARSDLLARKLAILRQENLVAPRLTVRELVGFGRYPHSRGRLGAEDAEKVDAAIGQVGLAGEAGRFLDQLSGGQRQRAFIAMVLAQETDYLLLDEPLNSLDLKHATRTMRLVRRLADELGKTVLVVLHDINIAATYCDRVIGMRTGGVMYDGNVIGFMIPDILKAIYEIDFTLAEAGGRRLAFPVA